MQSSALRPKVSEIEKPCSESEFNLYNCTSELIPLKIALKTSHCLKISAVWLMTQHIKLMRFMIAKLIDTLSSIRIKHLCLVMEQNQNTLYMNSIFIWNKIIFFGERSSARRFNKRNWIYISSLILLPISLKDASTTKTQTSYFPHNCLSEYALKHSVILFCLSLSCSSVSSSPHLHVSLKHSCYSLSSATLLLHPSFPLHSFFLTLVVLSSPFISSAYWKWHDLVSGVSA